MGWLKKLFGGKSEPGPETRVAGASDEAGGPMMQVLASLGVPLDLGVTTPEAALVGGLVKASIFQIVQALQGGELKAAILTADDTLGLIEKKSLDPRLAGVCLFLRARAWAQIGERDRAGADLEAARRLYPNHPLIENAYAAFTGAAAPPRFYAPSIAGAVEVKRLAITDDLEGVLRRHPAPEQQAGSVKYLYTLAVQPRAGGEAVLYVASEINKMPPEQRSGSHFLGVFPGQGHLNLGASDDWADLDKFEARAIEAARRHLARG